MKLFGIGASEQGARRLAAELGHALASHEEREFEDGEFKIRALESVRRERVVVYQSLSGSLAGSLAGGRALSVNDKLMRAFVFAGALRDAGADEVVLVAPYLAYARKDQRTKSRDPVTSSYIARMCEAVGIDEIIVLDVHNPAAFENAFRCRKRNIEAAPLFAEHFRAVAATAERVVVLSPDSGGVRRARRLAELLIRHAERAVDIAFVEKHRSEGIVSGSLFAGDVRDAVVIAVDDMISSGTTLRRAASLCAEFGARSFHAAATHGVFTPGASVVLADPLFSSIAVTDSVSDVHERSTAFAEKLAVLASARVLAGALR